MKRPILKNNKRANVKCEVDLDQETFFRKSVTKIQSHKKLLF